MTVTREECRRFLDAWDAKAFEDPQLNRRLADRGRAMVRALGDPPELLAPALGIQGSSWRAVGNLRRAETLYREAGKLLSALILSSDRDHGQRRRAVLDQGHLDRRWAYLRMEQRRFPEALDKITSAEVVFLAANDVFHVGVSQLARGVIHIERGAAEAAIPCLSRALTCIDSHSHGEAAYAASYNLHLALADTCPDPERLEETLRQVTEGRLSRTSRRPSRHGSMRRQLMGHRRRALPDAKARGLQGRILVMLAQHDDARRLLETAREDLISLGALLDAAAHAAVPGEPRDRVRMSKSSSGRGIAALSAKRGRAFRRPIEAPVSALMCVSHSTCHASLKCFELLGAPPPVVALLVMLQSCQLLCYVFGASAL
jgi:tetratricopeptide (TPR) repeat protein